MFDLHMQYQTLFSTKKKKKKVISGFRISGLIRK